MKSRKKVHRECVLQLPEIVEGKSQVGVCLHCAMNGICDAAIRVLCHRGTPMDAGKTCMLYA